MRYGTDVILQSSKNRIRRGFVPMSLPAPRIQWRLIERNGSRIRSTVSSYVFLFNLCGGTETYRDVSLRCFTCFRIVLTRDNRWKDKKRRRIVRSLFLFSFFFFCQTKFSIEKRIERFFSSLPGKMCTKISRRTFVVAASDITSVDTAID